MKLLHDTVLVSDVRDIAPRSKTLHLPDDIHTPSGARQATVEMVGTGVKHPDIKKGNTVVVKEEWGTRIKIDGKDMRIYDYKDILAVTSAKSI